MAEPLNLEDLLAEADDQLDQLDGDDEVAVTAGGDNYAWQSGYSGVWQKAKERGKGAKEDLLIYGQGEASKPLLVDSQGRLRRPYITNVEYEAERCLGYATRSASALRSLVLIIDHCESMGDADYKPTRIQCVKALCKDFIKEFFELSPISSLSIIAMDDKDARVECPPTGSADTALAAVNALGNAVSGDPSVQAAVERGIRIQSSCQPFYSREILMIFGSCSTVDAANLLDTVKALQSMKLRTTVISLSPEMRALKLMTSETEGEYIVCMSQLMLRDALMSQAIPQTREEPSKKDQLLLMGFPELKSMSTVSLCVCHNQLKFEGFHCPRCQSRTCKLPSNCKACNLTLATSLDIAKCQSMGAFVLPFIPLPKTIQDDCCCCARKFVNGAGQCVSCSNYFCFDCDVFIHEKLKFCPGCSQRETLVRQKLPLPAKRDMEVLPPAHPDAKLMSQIVAAEARRYVRLVE